MQLPFFIDFHCHPSMKPYGRSFAAGTPGANPADAAAKNSLWYYDPPSLADRLVQLVCGVVKFRQADCRSLVKGHCRVVFASLYPIERGFFRNKLGQGIISDLANDFITSVSQSRVNYIQGITNYFEDVVREYRYYEALHGRQVQVGNKTYLYRMVRFYKEIEAYQTAHPGIASENTVFICPSIEGMHVLNNNMDAPPDEASFLANLQQIKSWEFPPLFVTFTHHFYNHLCGHAKSLFDIVGAATDQREGINTGFTPLGMKVAEALLSKTNGKRIYIDIKHMSAASRREYLAMLASAPYAGEAIPVIVSHGAANGRRSMDAPDTVDIPETGNKLMSNDINFYDEELVAVARSGGLFGLQLDERRLASKETVKKVKHSLFLNKIQHYRAELVWNQVQHIAEVLDKAGLPAWDCIALGTDHDGIINPLNGYLSSENLPDLLQYLERYAFNYMSGRGKKVLRPQNRLESSDIANKIFSGNGMAFLQKWFV